MTDREQHRTRLVPLDRLSHTERTTDLGVVVLCKGVYDLTHLGHIRSLWAAGAMGDTLVVALASDRSVRERKGTTRPVLTFRERVGILSGLRMVDFVVEYDDTSPMKVIEVVRPQILCVAHTAAFSQPELARMKELKIDLRILERPDERSTSDIIRAITESRDDHLHNR